MIWTAAALAILLAAVITDAGRAIRPPAPDAGPSVQGPDRPGQGDPGDLSDRLTILAIEDNPWPTPNEMAVLLDYARAAGGRRGVARRAALRNQAVTALGRMERRDLVPVLFELMQDGEVRRAASLALLLTLRAHAPPPDARDPDIEQAVATLARIADVPAVLGNLPYQTRDQVEAAEARLRALLDNPSGDRAGAARGLEALARRNRRLAPLAVETTALLKKAAEWNLPHMTKPDAGPIVFNAFAALTAAGVMDADLVEAALGEESAETRRLGALALAGTGAGVDAPRRAELVRLALRDRAAMVRYEGLRAWVRHETQASGCSPITDALSDESLHVVLAAIDALGDRCVEDEVISARLAGEVRTPPSLGPWQREAHALVAAARRSPEAARLAMPAFAGHAVWQVRMYAARAAAILKDGDTLERLAYDAHDNVREAALAPLRTLKGADAEAALIAALGRPDHQLLRTAAAALEDGPRSRYVLAALVGALERLTAQRKDTSRDTRMALIGRIREQGSAEQAPLFERLLRDFDPKIAEAAAGVLQALTGRSHRAEPRPRPRPAAPGPSELNERLVARVDLDTGRFFQVAFDRDAAPLAYARFARLIRARYYDGLTFHRVVPNFVIQGGSPGANEYEGDGPFMRDELSFRPHLRGTVGISTRGRHTGDAQIFVNLVDNARLDFDYTVAGEVIGDGMAVVDAIQEGTVIRRIRLLPPAR